jgi:hypothetical protein
MAPSPPSDHPLPIQLSYGPIKIFKGIPKGATSNAKHGRFTAAIWSNERCYWKLKGYVFAREAANPINTHLKQVLPIVVLSNFIEK